MRLFLDYVYVSRWPQSLCIIYSQGPDSVFCIFCFHIFAYRSDCMISYMELLAIPVLLESFSMDCWICALVNSSIGGASTHPIATDILKSSSSIHTFYDASNISSWSCVSDFQCAPCLVLAVSWLYLWIHLSIVALPRVVRQFLCSCDFPLDSYWLEAGNIPCEVVAQK